ncbi:MAG: hypothetical protein LJE69_18005 [Thiohalocapsa sp.]|uniref:hypothetical protein n=1 Tax=Thiohalocapsa sp. TaxID=2497641 RepID=UPI0025F9F083|nr:hypothetical protein [Thiohalocapsa sp.]MCG6943129.1 hypothetical protein [Thiohalocapsa sp.]
MHRQHRSLLLAAAIIGVAPGAQATLMEYTDKGSFLAAVEADYYLEDFQGLTPDDSPASLTLGPVNGYGYSAQASSGALYFSGDVGSSGNTVLSTSSNTASLEISFTGDGVTALGGFFFPTDIDSAAQTSAMTLTFNGDIDFNTSDITLSDFYGFTSDVPITTLSIDYSTCGSSSCYPTLDDFYVGSASTADAPVPTTGALLAAGLLVMGARRDLLSGC